MANKVDGQKREKRLLDISMTGWGLIFLYFNLHALFLFGYKYLDFVARGHHINFAIPLIEEGTGVYGAFLLLPLNIVCARHFTFGKGKRLSSLFGHLGALCLYSFFHTSFMYGSRQLIFAALGWGAYDYGAFPSRFFMEFCTDALSWIAIAGFVLLFDFYRKARAEELRAAQLEGALVQAELQALRVQIEPHFIFNALNAIATVMYESREKAEDMLAALANLLRRSLDDARSPELRLSEERALLEDYLRVMSGRFESRLDVRWSLPESCDDALVPALVLQPLVENCFRHGFAADGSALRIDLEAKKQGEQRLTLIVRDNGVGAKAPLKEGVGHGNVRRRLEALYGDRASLTFDSPEGGGFQAILSMPLRHA